MKIAIVGTGISGLVSAYLLHSEHEVTVFEANDYIGGHTNTVSVELDDERHEIDTGFIVFNDRTYPNFIRLLDQLGVASDPTSMSFSVRCDRSNLEYNGTSLNGLFAQRSNLVRPRFHRLLADILRFNRTAVADLESLNEETTVADYLRQKRYSDILADKYLLPMGSAIWSCPAEVFSQFPIRFIIEFYQHHGLLSLRDRPVWRVIRGGSRQYVEPLTRPFRDRIRLRCPVERIQRAADGVRLWHSGTVEQFDEVILACHSDQALSLLADPLVSETEVLRAFPYGKNVATLHTDASVLPRRRRAWASWNYRIPADDRSDVSVSYYMNLLQNLESRHSFCVTLNGAADVDSTKILRQFRYSHPIYTTQRAVAQLRHSELIRASRTSYCGAYWGNGFHEDGVNSALAVCRAFGVSLDSADRNPGRLRNRPTSREPIVA